MNWGTLLREGQQRLLSALHDEPADTVLQEARLLFSWVSGRSTAWLLAHLEDQADSPGDADGQIIAERFIEAVSRRALQEPVAYITGRAGFYGQIFEVNPDVLVPRPDTELLVDVVSIFLSSLVETSENQTRYSMNGNNLDGNSLDHNGQDGIGLDGNNPDGNSPDGNGRKLHFPRILEVGTGSGCISCILALNHGNILIEAIDLSSAALDVAHRNAERLGVSDRIRLRRADVLSDDLARVLSDASPEDPVHDLAQVMSNAIPEDLPDTRAQIHVHAMPCAVPTFHETVISSRMQSFPRKPGTRYDAIVSNPPYIPSEHLAGLMPGVLRFEPRIALDGGPDGLVFYRCLLRISKDFLEPGGMLAAEIGYDQGITVPDLFREAGFVPTVHIDFGGNPRVVTGLFCPENP